nr:hypothetical protein OG690_15115 [Streptomyces tubercidicus]
MSGCVEFTDECIEGVAVDVLPVPVGHDGASVGEQPSTPPAANDGGSM